jgi:putative hydrolase of the HAD superfamily
MQTHTVRIADHIDTLLLDLDGTLFDLAFDSRFWLQVVPDAWGAARGLSREQALAQFMPKLAAVEGTLPWYCLDHWSQVMQLDLSALKQQHADHVAWLPGAQEFLQRHRAAGRRLVLATNSHPETLRIKMTQIDLTQHLDAIYSSHPFGVPKEDAAFWPAFLATEPIDLSRTAFLDDNLRVLAAGRAAGVSQLIAITHPDSSQAQKAAPQEFEWVSGVAQL